MKKLTKEQRKKIAREEYVKKIKEIEDEPEDIPEIIEQNEN